MTSAEGSATPEGLTYTDGDVERGRLWIEGLREASERDGVLVGDPEEELLSEYYPTDSDKVLLVPGFPFWRMRGESRPYQTASPMGIAAYRFKKDDRGQTWVYFHGPPDEDDVFEK